jgi:hypothetical protein
VRLTRCSSIFKQRFELLVLVRVVLLSLSKSLMRVLGVLVKMIVRYPRGLQGTLMRWGLPWGDLVMMRGQLLNFKALAER